ncbi:MAG TPA: tyrosine-type recombinase/integrase [Geobacteraceae bacterium]
MASLKRRGKTYYAQYYLAGEQKRVNLETTSLQVAKEKIRQIESALARECDTLPLPTKTPLSDIIERYLFQLSARTSERNVQKVATYLRSTFGQIADCLKIKNEKIQKKAVKRPSSKRFDLIEVGYLEHLTTEQVAAFLARLVVHKGISAKTANHYRVNLLTMCNWAKDEGGVRFPEGKNPIEAVKRYKEAKGDISFLKLGDIEEQFAVLAEDLPLRTMVAVYIYAGLRREEALWLMPADFNWDAGNHGTIRIRDKEFDGKKWVPKTKNNRTVPISSTLRCYLDEYLVTIKPGTWLFMSPDGCRWDPDNFSAHLRDVNKKVGLKWSCLDFRHTFGSHLAMKGESLYKISKIMGNSPQVCEKHYAHLMPESLYESVEFGEAVLARPEPSEPTPSSATAEASLAKNATVGNERPRLRLVISR